MAYERQNFVDGLPLSADQLNHMEDGILDLEKQLNSVGNVAYDEEQELTEEQKSQARANIGAQPVGEYLTEVPEGYAKNEDIEKVDKKVDTLREEVSKFRSNIVETASGETFVLDDSSDMELAGLRIFGKTTQNGTPTPDAPVPLESVGASGSIGITVAGKNLISLPYRSADGYQYAGITYTVNNDGSVTANGTATGSSWFNFGNVTLLPGRYKLSGCPSGGSANKYAMQVYNTKEDGTTGQLFSEEFGSSFVWTANKTTTKQFMIVIRSGYVANNLTFYPYLALESLHDGVFEKGVPQQMLTISTPNGLPGIPVTSGGNYTDENGQQWVCDEVDFASGKYVQRIDKCVITGTEDTVINGNIVRIIPSKKVDYDYVEVDKDLLCNTFIKHSRGYPNLATAELAMGDGTFTHFYLAGNATRVFFFKNSAFTDVATAKAWFAVNNTEILFRLATPIEHALSAEELAQYAALHTNYPNTTIFNDGGSGMEVKYVADTKLYIDKKFAELSTALLNQ